MKRFLMVPAITILLFGCGAAPREAPSSGEPKAQADGYVRRLQAKNAFPSFRCAVVDRSGVLYESGFGATGTTTFYAYSTTKIVTALAVLQLSEDGLLSLDDPLSAYLDYVPWPVTLRQVLSHSAGIPNPVIGNFYTHFPEAHAEFDSDAEIRRVLEKSSRLLFEPGTSVAYSNLGYALLGLVIEKVTGKPYPAHVREEIFEPLGIPSVEATFDPFAAGALAGSFITRNPLTRMLTARFMKGATFTRAGRWTALRREYYFDYPSHGGLIVSSRAFSTLLQAVLNRDPRLLRPDSFREWFTVQARGEKGSFTLGWKVGEHDGSIVYEHTGGAMGESARIAVYPARGLATVYLTNLLDSRGLVKKVVPTLEPALLGIGEKHERTLRNRCADDGNLRCGRLELPSMY